MRKETILQEVLSDQEHIKLKLKTIIASAGDTFQETQKILQDFEEDAQRSLALLEKEFADISEFVRKLDKKKSDQLDRNMDSFLDSGSEYTKKIAAAMLDIGKYQEKLDLLSKQIDQDHLTGVYNRRAWEHDIKEICRAANKDAETDKGFCVVMLDIDHFKKINDTHGHPIGDAILKQFGSLLKNHFTVTGSVYRYGGDEFAIIMPGMSIEEAERHVKSLRSQLGKTVFIARQGKTRINITISCGLSQWSPGMDHEEVVKKADNALYEAKEAGRNCIRKSEK
jgi:diguanylate cyclase